MQRRGGGGGSMSVECLFANIALSEEEEEEIRCQSSA